MEFERATFSEAKGGLKLRFTSQQIYYLLLAMLWSNNILVAYAKVLIGSIPFIGSFSNIFVNVFIIIVFCLSINYINGHVGALGWGLYFIAALIYLFELLGFSSNEMFLQDNLVFFLTETLVFIFVGLSFSNEIEKEVQLLNTISIASVIAVLLYTITHPKNVSFDGGIYQAYVLLPHLMISLYYLFRKTTAVRKILNILIVIAGSILLISYGNRGSVLLFILYIATIIIFYSDRKHRFVKGLIVVGIGMLIYRFFNGILMMLKSIISLFGMSTRVIDYALMGTYISDSSGRNNIQNQVLAAIAERPLLGYGLAGDQFIAGQYSHNLVLEMWSSFGVIIGSIILLLLVYLIIQGYRKAENNDMKAMWIVAFFCGFLKLFISQTFLKEPFFFMLIGLCLCNIRRAKYD